MSVEIRKAAASTQSAETVERVYPKAGAPLTWEVLEAANDRADRWMKRCNEARARLVAAERVCSEWDAEPNLPPAAYNAVDDVRAALRLPTAQSPSGGAS